MTDDAFTDNADKTATDSSGLLARVLLITQEMLDLARKDQWDLVTSKERDRRVLLARLFCRSGTYRTITVIFRGSSGDASYE